ncbi:hypothetical protein BVX97_02105 [bacterium E08(2017)]|nr:hypothetical protein BVX97_02105 [bacterium E08(2017)]
MTDCIFCKIIAGELPSSKIYEDENTLAFMDIGPVMKGHALVIPKVHCDPITDAPDEALSHTIKSVKKVANAIKKGLRADGINVAQANGKSAGQLVPHVHFHLIPRYDDEPQPRNWIPGEYDSMDEMNEYCEKIRSGFE